MYINSSTHVVVHTSPQRPTRTCGSSHWGGEILICLRWWSETKELFRVTVKFWIILFHHTKKYNDEDKTYRRWVSDDVFHYYFGIFPKVELSTSRYFENSQIFGNFDFPKNGKYPKVWEISIPNDSQKFSHFFDDVPDRGCVFEPFRWNVVFLFICFNHSIVNHDDGELGGQKEGSTGEYDKTDRN